MAVPPLGHVLPYGMRQLYVEPTSCLFARRSSSPSSPPSGGRDVGGRDRTWASRAGEPMSKRSERKERKRAQAQAAADVARVNVTGTNQGAQVRVQAGRDLANDPWAEQHRLRGAFGRFLVGVVVLTLTIAISGDQCRWHLGSSDRGIVDQYRGRGITTADDQDRRSVRLGGRCCWPSLGTSSSCTWRSSCRRGCSTTSGIKVFIASWVYSIIMALTLWLMASDDDDVFLVQAIRQSTRGKTWGRV